VLAIILALPPVSGLITLTGLFLLVKYSAYIPDNPKYRRNYDAILVEPRNPFTEEPSTIRQSELERQEARREEIRREEVRRESKRREAIKHGR